MLIPSSQSLQQLEEAVPSAITVRHIAGGRGNPLNGRRGGEKGAGGSWGGGGGGGGMDWANGRGKWVKGGGAGGWCRHKLASKQAGKQAGRQESKASKQGR